MVIRMSTDGSTLTVWLTGELDHHAARTMREQIDAAVERSSAKTLRLDFSGVGFMDSSGIGLLIGRYRQMKLLGGEMRIVSSDKAVSKMLTVSGIRKLVRVYRSVNDALKEGAACE